MTVADDIATVRAAIGWAAVRGENQPIQALDRIETAITAQEDQIESLEVELSGSKLSERQLAEAAGGDET